MELLLELFSNPQIFSDHKRLETLTISGFCKGSRCLDTVVGYHKPNVLISNNGRALQTLYLCTCFNLCKYKFVFLLMLDISEFAYLNPARVDE